MSDSSAPTCLSSDRHSTHSHVPTVLAVLNDDTYSALTYPHLPSWGRWGWHEVRALSLVCPVTDPEQCWYPLPPGFFPCNRPLLNARKAKTTQNATTLCLLIPLTFFYSIGHYVLFVRSKEVSLYLFQATGGCHYLAVSLFFTLLQAFPTSSFCFRTPKPPQPTILNLFQTAQLLLCLVSNFIPSCKSRRILILSLQLFPSYLGLSL